MKEQREVEFKRRIVKPRKNGELVLNTHLAKSGNLSLNK